MALQGRPDIVNLPEMLEDGQSLVTIPEQLIEFNKIVLQSFILLTLLLKLIAQGPEERVSEIDSIPSNEQSLQFEVNGEVVLDVVIQGLLVVD